MAGLPNANFVPLAGEYLKWKDEKWASHKGIFDIAVTGLSTMENTINPEKGPVPVVEFSMIDEDGTEGNYINGDTVFVSSIKRAAARGAGAGGAFGVRVIVGEMEKAQNSANKYLRMEVLMLPPSVTVEGPAATASGEAEAVNAEEVK